MKLFKLLNASFLIIVLSNVWSFAQTSKGTIAGTVTDSSGAVVTGATITAQDKMGSETRTTTSGPNGGYRIDAVTPSTYKVTVSSSNFSKLLLDDVEVKASVTTSLNAR